MKSRITLIQRNIEWLNIDANLKQIEAMLEGVNTDIVVKLSCNFFQKDLEMSRVF